MNKFSSLAIGNCRKNVFETTILQLDLNIYPSLSFVAEGLTKNSKGLASPSGFLGAELKPPNPANMLVESAP